MNKYANNPIKIFIVMVVAAVLLVSIAELLFILPGIRLPWGGHVTSCLMSEGSPRGWPFTAVVPGCGSESGHTLALVLDVIVDLLVASAVVGVFIRATGVMKRGHRE